MDPRTALVALFGTLAVFGTPVAIMYMWLRRPAARKDSSLPPAVAAMEARLERIEVAVQAIAIETERIAEGQRFTTKLLSAASESNEPSRGDRGGDRVRA
ncbi:MAG: hypothetical protein ABI338_03910 [Gemmatimonadaceae bacterium]